MKRSRTLTLMAIFWSLWGTFILKAARIDTLETYSAAMNKKIKAVVVLPDGYAAQKAFPVVYLLHGHGGDYRDWVRQVPALGTYADRHGLIIVCPDGGRGSWYLDSPVDAKWKYETYVATELVAWVDKTYKTVRSPAGRGITGLSMGGHGAFYLAFKHPDVFGAAGSMSGGVDIRPFPNNWDMAARLGRYAAHPENWERHTVINLLHLVEPGSLALMLDCGTDDFFFSVNEKMHAKMLERNITHEYVVRPGGHTWDYWANALPYQMLFMSRFFGGRK